MYVTDTDQLQKLVAQMGGAPIVAIDTEFMRERTYYARLCLIQVATDDLSAIIDPLAFDDLSALEPILYNEDVVKILHAGVQDLEIFYQLFGRVPKPLFDTQVAATLAGFPQQVGYGALVRELTGTELDKSDTFTDWSRRPLKDSQIEYALNDVRYLPDIYRELKERLGEKGRIEWLCPDFGRLEDSVTYEIVPEEMWRKVKKSSSLKRRHLGVLIQVAAWREREAQRRDLPRRWVLGDDSLVEIARRAPESAEAVRGIRRVGDKLSNSGARGIVEAVRKGLAMGDDELPQFSRKRGGSREGDGVVDLLAALVRLRAKEHGVAVPLLASRDEMERIASGETDGCQVLEGWRRTLVGEELLDLMDGKLAMKIDGGRVLITRSGE